jgi:hypothetical protein
MKSAIPGAAVATRRTALRFRGGRCFHVDSDSSEVIVSKALRKSTGETMKRKLAAQYIVLLLLLGCGVTDGSKGLVHQTSGAGGELEKHSDPAVAAAGHDIRLNMEAVGGEIGQPKRPMPYSPENSAAIRNQQKAEMDARAAWKDLADWALGSAAAVLGLGSVWGFLKNLKLGKVVTSLTSGIESLPADLAPKVKEAVLGKSLKAGVSDLLHGIVKSAK